MSSKGDTWVAQLSERGKLNDLSYRDLPRPSGILSSDVLNVDIELSCTISKLIHRINNRITAIVVQFLQKYII